MLRLRTIVLLILTGLCGVGLGLLSFFKDGAYTALSLFAFPFLVALMYLTIVADIVSPPKRETEKAEAEATASKEAIALPAERQRAA